MFTALTSPQQIKQQGTACWYFGSGGIELPAAEGGRKHKCVNLRKSIFEFIWKLSSKIDFWRILIHYFISNISFIIMAKVVEDTEHITNQMETNNHPQCTQHAYYWTMGRSRVNQKKLMHEKEKVPRSRPRFFKKEPKPQNWMQPFGFFCGN